MWRPLRNPGEVVCVPDRKGQGRWRANFARRTRLISRATAHAFTRLVLFTILFQQLPVFATGLVTLVWNSSPDPIVAGYKIYYGGLSHVYTNEIDVGNATNATIAGLVGGATYYFAATSYNAVGLESSFSGEVPYLVSPRAILAMQIIRFNGVPISVSIIANGVIPGQWTLQSSPDLRTWTAIAQGTNLAVNLLMPAGGLPRQFFRLVGQ